MEMNEKGEFWLTTKSGMKVCVTFSKEPPDYSRLADFFLLLSEKPEKNENKLNYKNIN